MIFDHKSRTGRGPLAAGSLTEIADSSPRCAAMSRGPRTRPVDTHGGRAKSPRPHI